jgi:hypothetical protein
LIDKPEGKSLLGISRRRLEDNIRMDLKEIVWEVVGWIHLVRDRDKWRLLVNTLVNFSDSIKGGEFYD